MDFHSIQGYTGRGGLSRTGAAGARRFFRQSVAICYGRVPRKLSVQGKEMTSTSVTAERSEEPTLIVGRDPSLRSG
jgi:hypothetical protein